MRIIRKWGIHYIEASADVEADPLYCGPDYIRNWVLEVGSAARKYGVTISSIFSGHSTYQTLGLGHSEKLVQSRFQEDWLKPLINAAADLGAQFGFFLHAIPQWVLHDPPSYMRAYDRLIDHLSYITVYGRDQRLDAISIEAMYTPNQPPWTIEGTFEMLRRVFRVYNAPLYTTLDTGHASAQARYQEPKVRHIAAALRALEDGDGIGKFWFGSKAAYDLIEEAEGRNDHITQLVSELRLKIRREVKKLPWMFASAEDGDIYEWFEALGGLSPIIHLQQTDGKTSSHLPFTSNNNITGIIEPMKLLRSLSASYKKGYPSDLPRVRDKVFLTLEIIPGIAQRPRQVLEMMRSSVEYWRRYVPEDGVPLDDLLKREVREEPSDTSTLVP